MTDKARDSVKSVLSLVKTFGIWVLISGTIGGIGGVVGSLFRITVSNATMLRETLSWLIFLLPLGGIVIAGIYKLTDIETENTNAIIDSIHFGDRVPIILVPVIFVATAITHLLGGSAGREGAALQIGGGIGFNMGHLFRLDEKDLRIATLCGMSAVFSALFGTPLTATIFAMEVISVGVLYYAALVPCTVSAMTAYGVMTLFGVGPTRFSIIMEPLSVNLSWRVAILAAVCAVMSVVFCIVMHGAEKLAAKYFKNTFVRAVVGGTLIIALTLLLRTTDYNGTGTEVIEAALERGVVRPSAFFWKLLFTAVTLGCGFKGGEVVPTFYIGAALGCAVGPLLGIPASFAAAVSLVAVFCGAVNCPVTSVILSVELFGSTELAYFALACGISYMLSGYFGLYSSQKIMYSKTKAEFINIQAK